MTTLERSHLRWQLGQAGQGGTREGGERGRVIGVVLYLEAKQVGFVHLYAESFTPVRTCQPSLLIASRKGQKLGSR